MTLFLRQRLLLLLAVLFFLGQSISLLNAYEHDFYHDHEHERQHQCEHKHEHEQGHEDDHGDDAVYCHVSLHVLGSSALLSLPPIVLQASYSIVLEQAVSQQQCPFSVSLYYYHSRAPPVLFS